LTIRDNGRGITEDQASDTRSFGLVGMRERASFMGGKARIEGAENKGTIVTVTFPLDGKEEQ
jgi:signal transduction histidine kinase